MYNNQTAELKAAKAQAEALRLAKAATKKQETDERRRIAKLARDQKALARGKPMVISKMNTRSAAVAAPKPSDTRETVESLAPSVPPKKRRKLPASNASSAHAGTSQQVQRDLPFTGENTQVRADYILCAICTDFNLRRSRSRSRSRSRTRSRSSLNRHRNQHCPRYDTSPLSCLVPTDANKSADHRHIQCATSHQRWSTRYILGRISKRRLCSSTRRRPRERPGTVGVQRSRTNLRRKYSPICHPHISVAQTIFIPLGTMAKRLLSTV